MLLLMGFKVVPKVGIGVGQGTGLDLEEEKRISVRTQKVTIKWRLKGWLEYGDDGLYLELTNLLEIWICLSTRSQCRKESDEFSLEQVVLWARKVLKQYRKRTGFTASLCPAKTFLRKITTMMTQNSQEVRDRTSRLLSHSEGSNSEGSHWRQQSTEKIEF